MSIPFSEAYGFRQRSKGFHGTALAGQTTHLDFAITEERWIQGIQVILDNHAAADTVTLSIIDKDNILGYGENFVCDVFGEDWNVNPDFGCQGIILNAYPAVIKAGLYIRISYTSTGILPVSVRPNFFLHKKAE